MGVFDSLHTRTVFIRLALPGRPGKSQFEMQYFLHCRAGGCRHYFVAMRKLRHVRLLAVLASAWLCLHGKPSAGARAAENGPSANVLALYSNQRMLPANLELQLALWAELDEPIREGRINFFEEFLEVNRLPFGEEESLAAALLAQRYRQAQPDIVLAVGRQALGFLTRWKDKLFPGATLVFAGVREDDLDEASEAKAAAGVLHEVPAEQLIAAISAIAPETEKAVLVGGSAPFDQRLLRRIRDAVASETSWRIEEAGGLSVVRISSILEQSETGTIALYGSYFTGPAGRTYIPRQVLEDISANANIPLFALYDTMIGAGATGIAASPMAEQGRLAGEIILRLLRGEVPEEIGILAPPQAKLFFDANAMRRHGLDPARLPLHAEILFRERGLIETHPVAFASAAVGLLVQSGFIAALLLARHRRRHAERRTRELERYFSAVFGENPSPIAVIRESDGTIVDVNPSWESLHGVSRQDACGKTPIQLEILPDEVDGEHYADFLSNRGTLVGYERKIRAKGGQICEVSLSSSSLEVNDERLLIVITTDISARVEAERLRTDLSRDNRVAQLGHLSAWIAHEINQPLSAMLYNAEAGLIALEREDHGGASALREILLDIREDNRRAAKVVESVRTMLGNRFPTKERFDLRLVAEDAYRMTRREAERRGVKSTLLIEVSSPLEVDGDRVLLTQVALNLLLNAFDAVYPLPLSRRNAVLGIRRSAGTDHAELFVRDSGPGVSAKDESLLFEPLRTNKSGGMGLGLAVSRFIAEDHGGCLDWERPEGGGSCFRLKLPRETPAL